ncbi:hypothetical protein BG015_004714 [Linnemannia schmuckeri]|uniref:F-box domain-containing protein n=1 Tax=Linnemannia schmuckeri TaxID=64567 RepID=A0A9P5VFH7_9FUNG|nr:hypothetical protein BG015_004714 [Linnemannia schmuckeri]
MKPATTRFFDVPELVAHLTKYLDHPGITKLMRTSRRMHDLCIPAQYRQIQPGRFFYDRTTDSIQSLAKNVHRVREMLIWRHGIVYYTNCVIAFLDLLATQHAITTTVNSQPALSRPAWLAPPDFHICKVVPIPPMTMLTKLNFFFGQQGEFEECPYYLPSYRDPKAIITQLCWLVSSNPHLLDLKLQGFIIKDDRDVRLLTRAISGLQRLQSLYVFFYQWEDWAGPWTSNVGIDLFFACPPTLRTWTVMTSELYEDDIDVFTDEYIQLPPGTLQSWERSDEESELTAATRRRQEPLLNLKTLTLGALGEETTEKDLRLVFQHCPNITTLDMPPLPFRTSDIRRLAQDIAQYCTKLSDLTFHSFGDGAGVAGELLTLILEALSPQQVTRFNCDHLPLFSVQGLGSGIKAGFIFRRHSSTLHTISLSGCQNIDSRAIQSILVGCALTELRSLDLRALFFDPEEADREITERYWETTFPGLLSLKNETTGRPGYLQLLDGLTKLTLLDGSVSATTEEAKATIGMMEVPTTTRFFETPELVAHVTHYVDYKKIAKLMRTSRRMHTLCTPAHYFNIMTDFELGRNPNVLRTPSLAQALARNVHHVRHLNLRRLSSYWDPKAIITQVCWIMDLNPHLQNLELCKVDIKDQRDICILATSLLKLKGLQRCILEFYHWEMRTLAQGLGRAIFFSCRSSLQHLTISSMDDDYSCYADLAENYNISTGDPVGLEEERRRMWSDYLAGARESFATIDRSFSRISRSLRHLGEGFFKDVGALSESYGPLNPPLRRVRQPEQFAQEIVRCCPKLRDLTNSGFYDKNVPVQELLVRTMRALPPQQLRTFHNDGIGSFAIRDLNNAGGLFRRHSTTLQNVTLTCCRNFDSKAIQLVLVECGALEELYVQWASDSLFSINLEDAVEFPWASTRMRTSHLAIAIPDEPFHHLANDSVLFYNRPSPTSLSETETQQLTSLEALYRQIGELTELCTLKLLAIFFGPQGNRPKAEFFNVDTNPFPGMLNLESRRTSRPSYLHHLGGLTKLETLTVSVRATTPETKVTIGMMKVAWMDHHWPALQKIRFFNKKEKIIDPFLWLRQQREMGKVPKLNLCRW